MSIRIAFTAIALSVALSPVFAGDQLVAFGDDDVASFIGNDPILAGGQDVISFTGLADGVYDFDLSLSGLNIDLTSIELDGRAGTVVSSDHILFADVTGIAAAPFALTLTGTPLDRRAGYSGQLAVSAVPETSAFALFAAGLGLLGLMSLRRKD